MVLSNVLLIFAIRTLLGGTYSKLIMVISGKHI